ncbi:MAG: M23 family metallopeptidase [Bacteroidales bacterium]|nr:M23 family metallopeptidase [Bacteroidales bacterium]MCF6341177.1 M23 family metallopeptidase [Bacteroidales bacterium]
MAKSRNNDKWYRKLRNKYRLAVFNDQTFEERFSFRLTRLNVIAIVSSLSISFIILAFFIIAYTPIKEYIPGYPNVGEKKQLYRLNIVADSLLNDIRQKNLYIQNIKNIIEDKDIIEDSVPAPESKPGYDTITLHKSVEDSLLRAEFENQNMYNLYFNEFEQNRESSRSSIRSFNFFTPINGVITSRFGVTEKHYGIDIVASHNEAVKSTLDGTVIFTDWTLETGYVIAVQHARNLISFYKHNSVLLKEQGEHVNAGDPIAIAGESGELLSGPHLHFELWFNGTPVNPEEYIIFE